MSVLWIPFPGALHAATHAARDGPATDIVHVASSIGRGSVSWLEFMDYAAVIHGLGLVLRHTVSALAVAVMTSKSSVMHDLE